MKYFVAVNGREHEVELVERLGELRITVDGEPMDLVYDEADSLGQVVLLTGNRSYAISIEGDEHQIDLTLGGHFYDVEIEDERERAAHVAERAAAKGGGPVKAVMPGVVVKLLVALGDEVAERQPLLILEAMKMQNEILSPSSGVVQALHVAEGEAVSAGTKLLTLAAPPE